jgi:hypothetical protein
MVPSQKPQIGGLFKDFTQHGNQDCANATEPAGGKAEDSPGSLF